MNDNRSFQKFFALWCGQLISSIGSGMSAFGLGIYVYQKTGLASATTSIAMIAFLPSLVLAPLAGVLADRYDRRLLMILGDGLSAIGLLYILLCLMDGDATLLQIGGGIFVSAIFASLLEPSFRATVTDLLSEDEYSKASGLVQLAAASKYLISPILAGFLMKTHSVALLVGLDIGTIFFTVIVTLFIRKGIVSKTPDETQSLWARFREGWQSLTQNRGVFVLVWMSMALTFFIGVIQSLATPMMLGFASGQHIGIALSVSACGMLTSGSLLSLLQIKARHLHLLSRSLFLAGLCMMGFGWRPDLYVVATFGFLFFSCLPFANAALDFLVRTHIDDHVQGRVWGLIGVISQIGMLLAYSISGVLSDLVFSPMLMEGGLLAGSVGKIIGIGTGRGPALLIITAGISLSLIALSIQNVPSVQSLDRPDGAKGADALSI
ncbi:MAG: MFS transporter [Peptostreptococcaceae bacterium]|nr:MFS transporter [Peptostreptococcaceae bacterium]